MSRIVNLADERERRRGDTRLTELDHLPAAAGDGRGWPALEQELTEVRHLAVAGSYDDGDELDSISNTQLGLFDGGAS